MVSTDINLNRLLNSNIYLSSQSISINEVTFERKMHYLNKLHRKQSAYLQFNAVIAKNH